MEKWDIYDKNRNRTAVRGSQMDDGDYHFVVHICIFNSYNKLLIQHRHRDKKLFPDVWDFSVGGSAQTGDTSQMAEDVDINSLILQEEEVQDARWVTKKEVYRLLDEGLFVSYQQFSLLTPPSVGGGALVAMSLPLNPLKGTYKEFT